jgi:hypothetical protein
LGALVALAVASHVCVTGCASTPGNTQTKTAQGTFDPRQPALSEAQFSVKFSALLRDGVRTGPRAQDLAQVVRHQLARAQRYFAHRDPARGLAAVEGALQLIRTGELQPGLLAGSERTLLAAAAAVARLGDEGRARAFYALALAGQRGAVEQRETLAHLKAIDQWQVATRDESPIRAAGLDCAVASARALVDRSASNVAEAVRASEAWVERAAETGSGASRELSFDIDDQREARYAKIIGSRLIVALHLRDGDARAAGKALQSEPFSAIKNVELIDVLSQAEDGEKVAWGELYGSFESWASSDDAEFTTIARGAAWGSALELYRLEPADAAATLPIAKLLVTNEAPDVAAVVISAALGEKPLPRDLFAALQVMQQAMVRLESEGDIELSRLFFLNLEPLLALAGRSPYASQTAKLVANVFAIMADLETQDGQLKVARVLLEKAVATSPTPDELGALAVIEWQQGDHAQALHSAEMLRDLAQKQGDATAEARGFELAYDILRDRAPEAEALAALHAALTRVLALRAKPSSMAVAAGLERSLASLLVSYGEFEAARRASLRAEEKSGNDHRQLTTTLLDAERIALTYSDFANGKQVLRRGLEVGLDESDLVYLAVWQRLLERRVHAGPDGAVEEALSRVHSDESWAGALRDWIRGKLDDTELAARAVTANEKIEGQFYPILAKHVLAQTDATKAGLRAVANSAGVNLIEVRIARDLLSAADAKRKVALPPGVVLP